MKRNRGLFFFIFYQSFLLFCSAVYGETLSTKIAVSSVDTGRLFFIRAISTKSDVYVGEPFIIKYILFYSASVIDPQANNSIKFNDCYTEEYPQSETIDKEFIKGKLFKAITIKKILVIANTQGQLVVPKLILNVKVASRDSSFFGQEGLVDEKISSNSLLIHVAPLPQNTDSSLFSGSIGSFKVKSIYSPSGPKSTDITFHLLLDGMGNTKGLHFSLPSLPKGIDVFNVNITKHDSLGERGIITNVEFTFQLVANFKGSYTIPSLTFSFFDPQNDRYKNFSTTAFIWNVSSGRSPPSDYFKYESNSENLTSYLYIKKAMMNSDSDRYTFSALFYALLGLGLLILLLLWNKQIVIQFISGFLDRVQLKIAKNRALKQIRKMQKSGEQLDDIVFHRILLDILFHYSSAKSKMSMSSIFDMRFNQENLNIPESIQQEINSFLSNQYAARFGYLKSHVSDRARSCEHLKSIIRAF